MHLQLTDEQEALRDAVSRFLEKAATPESVREAEPLGWDPAVWSGLTDMGVPTLGVAEDLGGSGASLRDLAVVAEVCGTRLAPAPVVETLVAARLLARFAVDDAPGAAVLTSLIEGGDPIVVALHPATDGRCLLVPGAAVAAAVIALDGDDLVAIEPGELTSPVDLASSPVADVDLAAGTRTVLATGDAAHAAHARAVDEYRALSARWLVGLARQAQAIGVQYATERFQFGAAIGSFQAIQHRFADIGTDLDGADLLSNKAVWALDVGDPIEVSFPAMAHWLAGDVAEQAASWSLHVHGGYGFMEEYDIQLYFRRAKGTRLLLGDPRRELLTLADRLWSDPSSHAVPATDVNGPDTSDGGFDFRLGADVQAFRDEVRAFLGEHVTEEVIETAHHTGTIHDWGLHRKQAAAGHISAGWPAEYGGGGRSPLEMNALSEDMYLSGAPVDGLGVASLVAHTILIDGTEWQKETIVAEILRGEAMCCLGYSEPDAGSDVASVATKATRDGDEWTITGQKMFTTLAHEAHYVFLLARTNTDVAKHKGLTMFIIPMDAEGISITPVHTMGGERTNITYYDDVKVDDRYRVGAVDGGWKVMMTALVFERNGAWYGELVRLLDHGLRWARSNPSPAGGLMIDDPLVRDRLARIAIGNEVSNLLGWRAAWMASIGVLPSVEGSMAKLATTEHYRFAADALVDALGTAGLRRHGDPTTGDADADGWIEAIYRHCQVTTIYGGTSEVQRGIIAERGLGLPRNR
jgi:alkylation response protein AidB-like acyl-CoA dehydrogenase